MRGAKKGDDEAWETGYKASRWPDNISYHHRSSTLVSEQQTTWSAPFFLWSCPPLGSPVRAIQAIKPTTSPLIPLLLPACAIISQPRSTPAARGQHLRREHCCAERTRFASTEGPLLKLPIPASDCFANWVVVAVAHLEPAATGPTSVARAA